MPPVHVQEIEDQQAGWTDQQLASWSHWIGARLFKRYTVPFADPVPETVLIWLVRIVTWRAYIRRGVDPTDPEMAMIAEDAKSAMDEVKEAADAENGLFDLPLRNANTSGSAVTRGGPRSYSEHSPYVAGDIQREIGRQEDGGRRGF